MKNHTEQWRPALGWEGNYEVSNQGRVRSLDRFITYPNGKKYKFNGKILSPADNGNGYLTVSFHSNGKETRRTIHSLVLEAFLGPRPAGMQACHNDGDRQNNHIDNLRWDTVKANHADKKKHGTAKKVPRTHCFNGHPLEGDNLLIQGAKKSRVCLICKRANARRYYELNKEKRREYARNYYHKHYSPAAKRRKSLNSTGEPAGREVI